MIRYLVPRNAKILFVGINPHYGSYARGVPFSNNKTFWYNLAKSGIIKESIEKLKSDKSLKSFYYKSFESYSLGFTNLVDRPSHDVSQLKKGEETQGIERLIREVKEKKPKVVCFVGRVTYTKFSRKKKFSFGLQRERFFGSLIFVARFPIRGPSGIRISELKRLKKIAGEAPR